MACALPSLSAQASLASPSKVLEAKPSRIINLSPGSSFYRAPLCCGVVAVASIDCLALFSDLLLASPVLVAILQADRPASAGRRPASLRTYFGHSSVVYACARLLPSLFPPFLQVSFSFSAAALPGPCVLSLSDRGEALVDRGLVAIRQL
jgi:hypothetical protein